MVSFADHEAQNGSPMPEKLPQLQAMLEKQPNDPFLLYAIAMEHKKTNDTAKAIDFLLRCICAEPNYLYAYFQLGQVQEMMGKIEEAKKSYQLGITGAKLLGDAHALSELEGALGMLG